MTGVIDDFVRLEAALLDQRCLAQWVTLFAPDGLLWVPGRVGEVDPARHVSIIYDHLPQLKARVNRLLSGKESAQEPPSKTLRSITNLAVIHDGAGTADGLVTVETVQVIYETRALGQPLLVLPCRVRFRLRPLEEGATQDTVGEGAFRIVEKRIDLLEVHRHFDSLSFLL